jgi:hypothetical protein
MTYSSNELSYNPYNYPSPYQPGQTLPDIDESEMIDIGSLQKFSMVYVSLPLLGHAPFFLAWKLTGTLR